MKIHSPLSQFSPEELKLYTRTYYQLSPDTLVQHATRRKEGIVNDRGALCIATGEFTGRSPKDKFIVYDDITCNAVNWNEWNQAISAENFGRISDKMWEHLKASASVWIRDAFTGGADGQRIALRFFTTTASGNLFCYNMFVRPGVGELHQFVPEWTIVFCPGFKAVPASEGTRSAHFAVISFSRKEILIGGTGYTGEIKKAVFTVLNFLLPQQDVLPLHCSVNKGSNGETALFFGLSGTGKTTLSSDINRELVGDDEHGWAQDHLFNLEGGCYAKTIRLSKEAEPLIYNAIQKNALVENMRFYEGTCTLDFDNATITENMRASYPLPYITGKEVSNPVSLPGFIFLLSCDAYGLLPPVAKLSPEEAVYYFLCGYTAKIAGTEAGVQEPVATFSPCFGAPFFPRSPQSYATMLRERLAQHRSSIWMVNTGWTGGGYGEGSRIPLSTTRAIIGAVLDGSLDKVETKAEPVFGLSIPLHCPGVDPHLLFPSITWKDEKSYHRKAYLLKAMFEQHILRLEKNQQI